MSVGTCAWKRERGTVERSHGSAVTAWKPVTVTNLGVLIPQISADANPVALTVFYVEGIFRFAIKTAITIAQADQLYYDTAVDAVVKVQPAAGFVLGVAVSNGTAAGGFVDVDINVNPPAWV
jgi:hypothetical protein